MGAGVPRERRRTSMRRALAPWWLAVAVLLSVTSPAAGRGTAHTRSGAALAAPARRSLGWGLRQYNYPKDAFDRTPLNGAAKGARAGGQPDPVAGLTNPDIPALSPKSASMEDVVLSRGYPLESYPVETSDGFILRLYRIPHGVRNATGPGPKPVVLLHHGLGLASIAFTVLDPGSSMGFFLADAGFDVWMVNTRGNTFSTGHRYYKNTDPSYWQFSMDEQALIDLPAQIDFALKTTGQSSLALVGHSQGGTLIEMLLAGQPEYNDKVWLMVMLGPVTYAEYIRAPFTEAAARSGSPLMMTGAGIGKFLPNSQMSQIVSGCTDGKAVEFCHDMIHFGFHGYSKTDSPDDIKLITSTWSATMGARNLVHWSQMYHARRGLQMFDYGTNCTEAHGSGTPYQETCNQAKYGQDEPPLYDLENIKAKAALFRADLDLMALKPDTDKLVATWGAEMVYDRMFVNTAHADIILSRNPVMKPDIIDILWRFAPKPQGSR